ncbi:MAG: SMC-Scp complex subunit ScpB, partial [Thermoleophilia bacterium]|nr:SMC-Scp complex subunit ScpB [Thermoleophilia bacterium]
MTGLARLIEALLFLAPEPVPVDELADALQASEEDVTEALGELRHALGGRGVVLREVGEGFALASHPDAEEAARRLLARPRTPSLTPAQAETLSIVAYLQPVSRPEVARIRGVASESAAA